ncbi:M48 family metallopeptidase [Virgibacillus kimchii]
MPTIKYGTTSIHYSSYREERKDIRIVINLVNGVEVYFPTHIEDDVITRYVQQKAPWITQKISELNEIKTIVEPIEFVSGEKIPYLGRNYRLKVLKEPVKNGNIQLKQGRFIATVPQNWSQEEIQFKLEKYLTEWYRIYGFKKIKERLNYYQPRLGIEPKSIQLRTQYKRWGTCTPNGNIYINWRILMAPVRIIDYIVVHELVHLIVPEHNEKFWRLVKATFPHYEEAKEWLRVNGYSLETLLP